MMMTMISILTTMIFKPKKKKEIDDEIKKKEDYQRNHPLFKRAKEILKLVDAIIECLPEEHADIYSSTLMESALILAPKLAGAMGSDSWVLCMQNASIIRYHAEYLLTSTSGLKMFVKADEDYVSLMRKEMLEFQKLFKDWVKEFNAIQIDDDDYTDEWGLFLRK